MREKTQLDLELSPQIHSLPELAKAENACTRCPLYKNATQAVPGEGRRSAHVMLVGEQPGDKEDLSGKPFVGPAGASSTVRWRKREFRAPRFSLPMR
jgi:uracil-DNA glycosylase